MFWEKLTPRESAVGELLLEGLSNREIGDRLGMVERTVKAHIRCMGLKMFIRKRQTHHYRIKLASLLIYDRYPELMREEPEEWVIAKQHEP